MNGRKLEAVLHELDKLLVIIGKAAARTAESECGTENYGIAYLIGNLKALLNRFCYIRGANGLTDLLAELLEEVSVLGTLNACAGSSEKLNAALLEDSLLFELHCKALL